MGPLSEHWTEVFESAAWGLQEQVAHYLAPWPDNPLNHQQGATAATDAGPWLYLLERENPSSPEASDRSTSDTVSIIPTPLGQLKTDWDSLLQLDDLGFDRQHNYNAWVTAALVWGLNNK